MKIRFEADNQKDLQEFYEFLYDKHPEIVVHEENAMSPGTQNEPIVIALVVIAGAFGGRKLLPVLQQCYSDFIKLKMHRITAEKEIIKTSIQEGKGWKYVKGKDFTELEIKE